MPSRVAISAAASVIVRPSRRPLPVARDSAYDRRALRDRSVGEREPRHEREQHGGDGGGDSADEPDRHVAGEGSRGARRRPAGRGRGRGAPRGGLARGGPAAWGVVRRGGGGPRRGGGGPRRGGGGSRCP